MYILCYGDKYLENCLRWLEVAIEMCSGKYLFLIFPPPSEKSWKKKRKQNKKILTFIVLIKVHSSSFSAVATPLINDS